MSGSVDEDSDDCSADDDNWKWSISNWSDDEIAQMKLSVITLMEAAGEPTHKAKNQSIPDILDAFVLGTERRKEWIQRST